MSTISKTEKKIKRFLAKNQLASYLVVGLAGYLYGLSKKAKELGAK